MQIYKVLTEFV